MSRSPALRVKIHDPGSAQEKVVASAAASSIGPGWHRGSDQRVLGSDWDRGGRVQQMECPLR